MIFCVSARIGGRYLPGLVLVLVDATARASVLEPSISQKFKTDDANLW